MESGEGRFRCWSSDEPRVVWVTRAVFERAGHDVAVASSLREAGELLATVVPDAVIVDFILPAGDGLAFARRARAEHGVCIVIRSGLAEVPDSDDVVSVLKPFTPDQLEQALTLALARSRPTRRP